MKEAETELNLKCSPSLRLVDIGGLRNVKEVRIKEYSGQNMNIIGKGHSVKVTR